MYTNVQLNSINWREINPCFHKCVAQELYISLKIVDINGVRTYVASANFSNASKAYECTVGLVKQMTLIKAKRNGIKLIVAEAQHLLKKCSAFLSSLDEEDTFETFRIG